MGAAAQLDRIAVCVDHSDNVTVFFSKQRHRSLRARGLDVHFRGGHLDRFENFCVDRLLDIEQFLWGHCLKVVEVKAEAF